MGSGNESLHVKTGEGQGYGGAKAGLKRRRNWGSYGLGELGSGEEQGGNGGGIGE